MNQLSRSSVVEGSVTSLEDAAVVHTKEIITTLMRPRFTIRIINDAPLRVNWNATRAQCDLMNFRSSDAQGC